MNQEVFVVIFQSVPTGTFSTLLKAQRHVMASWPNAQQIDDYTWGHPSGQNIIIFEQKVN